MEHVVGEVGVAVGKGAAHVVVLSPAGLDQLLEFGHDAVIAAHARVVHPGLVVDLLTAVQREHHVAHLFVGEVDHIVVDQHPVGGQGKAEILAPLLFHAAGVLHQPFDHVPVHQRFAAEEVHFQIGAAAGMLHQEIQRPLAHLVAHQRPLAVVFALTGKAIGAVQVAGMGNVQAQGLDHVAAALLKGARQRGEGIRAEELSLPDQFVYVGDALPHIGLGHVLPARVLFADQPDDLLRSVLVVKGDDIVGHFVHRVDGAGAGVQHDVVAVKLILMNHAWFLRSFADAQKGCRSNHGANRPAFCRNSLLWFPKLLVLVFALLVGHAAAGLASRLAGGLAFAAAALFGALAQVPGGDGLDPLHNSHLLFVSSDT